ncbi:MAG: ATP synthase F0 subunit B [Nitrospirae bacterium]|nr:ATP synthase F0 subunit B [Nitrospirota bacterium]
MRNSSQQLAVSFQQSAVSSQGLAISFRNFRNVILSVCYSLLITFHSSPVFASGSEEAPKSLLATYTPAILNFLILVALLVFLMKMMDIKGFFRKRTELIEQSLKEAREAKELAQKALAQVEERLKIKDKELEEILKAAKESGEREKVRIIEEGSRLKERIVEQTKNNIDFEVKMAKETIKQEAVGIAMELAEKKLKDRLTKEEQIKLLEESLLKIEGKN